MPGNSTGDTEFPETWNVEEQFRERLRYGENPHQAGAAYVAEGVTDASVLRAAQLNPTADDCSYVNYLDAASALELVREFERPAATVVKHTNPAGCATAPTVREAYERAHATDPMSAFGGIVALNRECDADTAAAIRDGPFKATVVAPGYTDDALERLRSAESLRILAVGGMEEPRVRLSETQLPGGRLVQERNLARLSVDDLEPVTDRTPSADQYESLLFAWRVVTHVYSNATVLATGTETVGIGAGQPSRIDSVVVARRKAREHAEGKAASGGVLATDGFAFPDTVAAAAEAGIEAIVQPGGSVRDDEVIAAANEADVAMAFTGQRCFEHG